MMTTSWMPVINPNLRSRAALKMRAVVMSTPSHIPLNRAGDVNVSVAKIMVQALARPDPTLPGVAAELGMRLMAQMMAQKSQQQDQALIPSRDNLIKDLQGCRSQARPESVSIDEQMIPFTGACPYGIVLDFDLYQGSAALREQVEEPEGLGLGSLVMARLCKTLHRGTKVYCDRLFTSIQGAEQMLKKELYLTDLALANSWLLYRKDLGTCGAPRKSIMQFLEFRMDVARTFLAQHHSQEEDAEEDPELSEGDDDSSE
ncbi:hypothetical protein D4764_0159680, partial [Takifugu flavidus]